MKKINLLFSLSFASLLFLTGLTSLVGVSAASCNTPATTYGTDTMSASIPASTSYTIWVQIQTPTASSNSILLNVNGSNCFNVGGSSSLPTNTWNWISYQDGNTSSIMRLSLPAGSSNLELIGTQPGILVNQILLLADSSCTPKADGSNCTTSQSVTATTTTSTGTPFTPAASQNQSTLSKTSKDSLYKPVYTSGNPVNGVLAPKQGSTTTISSSVVIEPTIVPGLTIKEVYYYLDNNLQFHATKSPFTYKLDTNWLENGKYKLTTKTVYTNGTSRSVSETIAVSHFIAKNVAIFLINNILTIIFLLLIIGLVIWRFFPRSHHFIAVFSKFMPNSKKPQTSPTMPLNIPEFPVNDPTVILPSGNKDVTESHDQHLGN